jgi:hypothetical protein
MTHGHFVADQYGMSFKFDTFLNPQSVYGVMLRLKQASWLDSFDDIVCYNSEDMWEVRKRFPKVSQRVRTIDDLDESEDANGRQLCIQSEYSRISSWDMASDWYTINPLLSVYLEDLAPVATVTSSYA